MRMPSTAQVKLSDRIKQAHGARSEKPFKDQLPQNITLVGEGLADRGEFLADLAFPLVESRLAARLLRLARLLLVPGRVPWLG